MTAMSGNISVDKDALAQQFSAAAERYDVWAKAQAEIAARLMQHIPAELSPSLIVDLGCGTGLLSAHLLERYAAASLVGIDLAGGMVNHCCNSFQAETTRVATSDLQPRARFVLGDVEDRASLVPQAGLVASNCVAQWFADLPATVCMWAKALAPAGAMAFACLLEGSFCELDQAYREALGRGFRGLSLPASEVLPRLFRACGLRPTVCVDDAVTARYAGGRLALRRLIECYDRKADSEGMVSVTYRVQYIVAEREQ